MYAKFPSNPSLYKTTYQNEKINSITRSTSKFISIIYFSIKIIIRDYSAENGGHAILGSIITLTNTRIRNQESGANFALVFHLAI